ncbi:AraC family transcriptional regulator [Paenibacillus beijingensis]|uniref:AraC family transcriptional regulator n=1 Tax=Paenibacillus beijingensis TaxID=1126833 RepID=A0A0D5NPW8_9BACL|nr:AraC family transcriptional regulator [Paenibacillus beijingensis]AJY77354.1 AraC family transcriptional regulator [Paenibacillus beijingensis]
MILHQISPYIRVAMDNIVDRPWVIQERVLFDYELLYIMEGKIIVTIENEVYDGERGDIFLFRPKQKHKLVKVEGRRLRQPHIHFDFFYGEDSEKVKVSFRTLKEIAPEEQLLFRADIIEQMPVILPSRLRLRNPILIEKMLMDIIYEYETKMPFYEFKVKGMFIQLWIQLLRENYWSQNPHLETNMHALMHVKQYLMHNTNRKVSLDEIAKMSGISKHYLGRLFQKAFGMSPIQYHHLMRVHAARHLIQFTTDPLSVISEKMGFSNIHAFSRFFKTVEGISPSFYRSSES